MDETEVIKDRIEYCQRMAKSCKDRRDIESQFRFLRRADQLNKRLKKLMPRPVEEKEISFMETIWGVVIDHAALMLFTEALKDTDRPDESVKALAARCYDIAKIVAEVRDERGVGWSRGQ